MKKYALEPFNQKNLLNNKIFESPFKYLKLELAHLGVDLETVDQVNLEECEKVLFFNHNSNLLNKCINLGVPKEKLILFLWEPETVLPLQYTESIYQKYGKVFTFRDDLVQRYQFIKTFYPQGQTIYLDWKPADDRKFLTLINANKYSYHPNELYSLRRKWIDFFENKNEIHFKFFGVGWNKNPFIKHPKNTLVLLSEAYRHNNLHKLIKDLLNCFVKSYGNYGGPIKDKYQVLLDYNFCLCIENEDSWFTEKIFDSLACGNIPLYKGPEEIINRIPEDCFINLNKFSTFENALSFILDMSAQEIERRKNIIKDFLNSPGYQELQPENLFKKLAKDLI